jgi:hypothetical protein
MADAQVITAKEISAYGVNTIKISGTMISIKRASR